MESVGKPVSAGESPTVVAVDPSGSYVYVGNSGFDDVTILPRDGKTGALSPQAGAPAVIGGHVLALAIHPSGRFAYVASLKSAGGLVQSYVLQSKTGSLSINPTSSVPGQKFLLDPSGRFAYVMTDQSMTVHAVDPTTGAVKWIQTIALPGGGDDAANPRSWSPSGIQVSPTGQFLYASLSATGKIFVFAINPSTGELDESPTLFQSGMALAAMAMDLHHSWMYLASGVSGEGISYFPVESETGALGATRANMQLGATIRSMRLDPPGVFLLAAAPEQNQLTSYRLEGVGGKLQRVAIPVATGKSPSDIAVYSKKYPAPGASPSPSGPAAPTGLRAALNGVWTELHWNFPTNAFYVTIERTTVGEASTAKALCAFAGASSRGSSIFRQRCFPQSTLLLRHQRVELVRRRRSGIGLDPVHAPDQFRHRALQTRGNDPFSGERRQSIGLQLVDVDR